MFIVGKCRLNEILKSKRMTQIELADSLGMKKQQINSYANSDTVMSLKTAKNIAYKLNVPIEQLYDFIWSNEQ